MTTRRTLLATALPRLLLLLLLLVPAVSSGQEYVLIGWNDLGMHCSNQDFSKIAVLPPFNNVTAQLIERDSAGLPRLVTAGFTVEYSIPGNTTSAGKTNFWTYAQQLFGLGLPLPQDVGLTGSGLSGTLTAGGTHFFVTGIPVTPYADSDLVHEAPFQLVHLVARRNSDGAVVATTDAVIPVSNEVGCVQAGCHSSETAILDQHEDVSGFNRAGPVLCASCHASNALGTAGTAEARPFSYRMHGYHAEVAGPARAIETCYKCHPGPNTRCLRDIMGRNPVNPLVCQDCHGTMDTLAVSILNGRRPWLDEPRCGGCHGASYAEEPGKLYRQSTGHGGLSCSACHGSPHAILPTVQPNDNVQNIAFQGYAGTLRECSVCHWTHQADPGPHGITDTAIATVPEMPSLQFPADGVTGVTVRPMLEWATSAGAHTYTLEVSPDSLFGTVAWADSGLEQTWIQPPPLASGTRYFWRVMALNPAGPSGWSAHWSFTTSTGTTTFYEFRNQWNLVSVPVLPENPRADVLFPSAVSPAWGFDPETAYHTHDSLSPGPGYWLRFDRAQSIGLTGAIVDAETVDVAAGWNIIGSISDPMAWSSARTIPPGIVSSMPFTYRGSYLPDDSVLPAHGYWLKVETAGKVVLSAAPPEFEPAVSCADPPRETVTLTFVDADGRSGKLLASPLPLSGKLLRMYEMPPPPPAGAFDVRFESESMLAAPGAVTGGRIGVRVSAMYPLTISWEAGDGNGELSLEAGGEIRELTGSGTMEVVRETRIAIVKRGTPGRRPAGFTLEQNTPNPFNPSTSIAYTLPADCRVELGVYTMLGELVESLDRGIRPAGTHSARWEPRNITGGVYFLRLEAVSAGDPGASYRETRKMLFIK